MTRKQPVVTLTWLEANLLPKPFALGNAVFNEAGLGNEMNAVLVCLAFHLFAVAVTPPTG
jgi:hypothetical protein